jgi:hypothetical protein
MEGLDQEAKTKQTLKCNLFLMIARRALIKHFKVWMNNLLFLAIYGEGPTGRIVARYLSPPNTTAAIAPGLNDMQVFESPIHNNRLIDLKSLRDSFQNSVRYKLHFEPAHMSSPSACLSSILQIQAMTCGTMMLLLFWIGSNSTTLWTMQHSHRTPIELSQMSRMPISVKWRAVLRTCCQRFRQPDLESSKL